VYNGVHTIVLLVAFSLSVYAAKTVRDFENDTKTTVRFSIGKPHWRLIHKISPPVLPAKKRLKRFYQPVQICLVGQPI
ncbi:MAG: hypothetical protein ACPHK4_03800, partial [Candidatus Puniceispirillaceae bacterium]